MDFFSLSSTVPYSPIAPPLSTATLAGKYRHVTALFVIASNSSQDSAHNPTTSTGFRRPTTQKPLKSSSSQSSQLPENPLKSLFNSQSTPSSVTNSPSHDSLSNKLWLSSKLSPPPPPPHPPPPPPLLPLQESNHKDEVDDEGVENSEENEKEVEFREKGKIFVGNLPLWIKKNEVAEFFRQFGPIKNVILIKGHDELERNMGFGFVIYSGHTAEEAAMKAVEFDGVEFHGRVLTVKLDNGTRVRRKYAERARWMEGKEGHGEEYRSKWHEERECSRREFRKVLDSQPEKWQAVVRAFERIKKV